MPSQTHRWRSLSLQSFCLTIRKSVWGAKQKKHTSLTAALGGSRREESRNSYFRHKLYANELFSWRRAGSERVFHELKPCSSAGRAVPLIRQLKKWERMSGGEASHYRGRSSLYKPAKAGCAGHSLPTVTRSPAQIRTASPHKDSSGRVTLGGSARGSLARSHPGT